MSTQLTELEDTESKALTTNGGVDPFAAYADAVAPKFIIGEMLKFNKGDWLVGDSTDALEIGTQFTVAMDELMAGWIKWFDSKPVEHLMVRVADGVAPKTRPELGDLDQSQWVVDKKTSKPKDPWQLTNYLPLMDDNGELYTFVTASRGGFGAIADLARRYARHRKRHPDVFPVIKLSVDSYKHKDPELGIIKVPVFEPAGYVPKTDMLAALAGAGVSAHEPDLAAIAEGEPEEDKLNDKIPF